MSLPPDSDSPSEYDSNRPLKLTRADATHLKDFTGKIGLTRNLIALQRIKQDIQRSNLQQNMQVRQILQQAANKQAKQLGFKGERGNENWWN